MNVLPCQSFFAALRAVLLVFRMQLTCTLSDMQMFLTLAKDRLERLNASPSATPAKYFRVFSALLFVVSADFLW